MLLLVTTLSAALLSAGAAQAAKYTLVDKFDSSNFFSQFEFYSGADPTHGFVQYVDNATASKTGLAGYSKGGIFLGADHSSTSASGRASTRVSSKKSYTKGLFIADIAHMPVGTGNGGSCGLWPAFWMFGPSWPSNGEIDIIEGVHNQASDAITLHTSDDCSMANTGTIASTKLTNANCEGNTGCGQTTSDAETYGPGFNAAGGGVYAVEWTSQAISVWFWSRSDPMVAKLTGPSANDTDSTFLSSATPDPATFGAPVARFAGNTCDIDSHFANHSLVFNIDFCGDWAGNVWNTDATCSKLAPTCNEYVQKNPQAFTEAYWLINRIDVFSLQTASAKREKVPRRFDA